MSLVEKSIIHCPYLGGSPIGGFTVLSVAKARSNEYYERNVSL